MIAHRFRIGRWWLSWQIGVVHLEVSSFPTLYFFKWQFFIYDWR